MEEPGKFREQQVRRAKDVLRLLMRGWEERRKQ
jgi:hypothetical protein